MAAGTPLRPTTSAGRQASPVTLVSAERRHHDLCYQMTRRRETGRMVDPGITARDAERQQAIDLLRAHTGAGGWTLDEFGDLAAQVYAESRPTASFEAVADNLPPGLVPDPQAPAAGGPGPAAAGGSAAVAPRSPLPAATCRRRFIAVMSGSQARGRWRAPTEITALAFWGGVLIDPGRARRGRWSTSWPGRSWAASTCWWTRASRSRSTAW